MFARYLEKVCHSRRVLSHMAMVQRDMELDESRRDPLSIVYADYIV